MKASSRRPVAASALLVATAPLHAQGIVGATPQRASGRLAWQIGIDASSGYESNARFERPGDPGDVVERFGASGGFTLRGPRTLIALATDGDVARYETLRDLDHVAYRAGIDATRTASRRLTLHAGAAAARTQTSEISQDGVSLLARLARARTLAGAADGVYRLTPRATLTADASVTDIRYDAARDAAPLPGGTTTTGEATLARQQSSATTVGLRYRVELTQLAGTEYASHGVGGDWRRERGPLALHARLGGVLVASDGAQETRAARDVAAIVGDAGLARTLGWMTASLDAGRTVSPTIGIGRMLITNHVDGAIEHADRRTRLRVSLGQAWSSDATDPSQRLQAFVAAADVRRQLGGTGAWVLLGATHRRQVTAGAIHGTALTLGLGTATGR